MISLFTLTLVFFAYIRAEYPGSTTLSYGTRLDRSTLSPKNNSHLDMCCKCKTTKKPVTEALSYPQEIPIFRLPDLVWPTLYRFSFRIDFNVYKTLSKGNANSNLSITINVKNTTDIIHLNYAENILFTKVKVLNISGNDLTKNFSLFFGNIVQINLKTNLSVGEEYVIQIDDLKSVHYSNQDSGIIIRRYQNSQGDFENMLATQFQPESARMVFPCFDEPNFKSKFQINITTNSEYHILSNMPEIECQTTLEYNTSSWKTCVFETSPWMPVYNLAFAIVNFSYIEKIDAKGRRFRIWARASQINKTQLALNTTIETFELLEKKLKIDFPLKKVDSLAIPNLRGFLGMEHYGLITYDEPVITWNDKFPLSFSKYLCVSIICHEIAHQWFGNLVTMAWWQDLWLNEGFATYYSHNIAKIILKDEWYYPLKLITIYNHVRNFDDNFSILKTAISAPVSFVEAKFDYLSYKKGFIIVNMIERLSGLESFDLSIIDYLDKNKYNSTTAIDLWKSLNKFSNISISNIIDEWVNKVCYPIVEVRFQQNHSITINQTASIVFKVTKFKIKHKESTTDIWKIPLYIMFGNDTFQRKNIIYKFGKISENLKLTDFNMSNHWLILNTNYGSFFTTDCDKTMFSRLRHQLLLNHSVIPPLSRSQIMMDYYDTSKKFNRNNLAELLKLLVYIKNETDPVPLITAICILDKLNGLFEFRSFYPIWNKYVQKILEPTLNKLVKDFDNNFRDPKSMYVTLRRAVLNIACKLKLSHCLKITNEIIIRWQTNKSLDSDYDLLHIALCEYVEKDSNGENWERVYSSTKFLSWDYVHVKYYAMGCTKVPWTVEKNIDIAFNVLKVGDNRIDFPHVSQIVIDNIPADYLQGTTSLSHILVLSSIYNTPNSMHFLNRFNKDGLGIIYSFLQYPSPFPFPHSILEHAVPTLSHYNFLTYSSSQKDKSKNVILIEAKSNIQWILNNQNLEKQLECCII